VGDLGLGSSSARRERTCGGSHHLVGTEHVLAAAFAAVAAAGGRDLLDPGRGGSARMRTWPRRRPWKATWWRGSLPLPPWRAAARPWRRRAAYGLRVPLLLFPCSFRDDASVFMVGGGRGDDSKLFGSQIFARLEVWSSMYFVYTCTGKSLISDYVEKCACVYTR